MARGQKEKKQRVIKQNPHKINEEIKAYEVKLVGDGEPEVLLLKEALSIAEDKGLDLVMVGETANPPVVKLMDYSKYLYELGKNKPAQKPKPMKEVRFRPHTDDNDLNFKTKHIIEFLTKGHKVKVFVFFKGREMTFKEQGEKLLLNLAIAIQDHGIIESMPKMEGNKMNMFIKPKPKNEARPNKQD
jgi:translation initiation factor IF-3